MKLGMVGLGRMGLNMAKRLLRGSQDVVVYNRTAAKVKEIEQQGARGVYALEDLVGGAFPAPDHLADASGRSGDR